LQSFVKGPEGNCADLGQGMTLRTVGVRWAEGYPSKIRAGAPKPALRLGFHHLAAGSDEAGDVDNQPALRYR
jgi:hypothetical protein